VDLSTVFRATPGVLASRVGEEVALLHLERGIYFGLNATSAGLWERLQRPTSTGELLAWLLAEYEVGEEQGWADLQRLLKHLQEAGLVEVLDATAPPQTG
jgi:hypothetical protein